MINWKKLAVVLGASAALLCGCTQSNIVSPTNGTVQGDGVPDVEIDKDIPINWLEVREDLRDVYLDPCLRMIEQKQYPECQELYTRMVRNLQKEYFFEH